jgi:hypothetical protein
MNWNARRVNSSGMIVSGIRRESDWVRKDVMYIHRMGAMKITANTTMPTQKIGPLRWRL